MSDRSASEDVLRVAGLARSYGATAVLRDVDLRLGRGERLAVVGASGGGKTTLLRLIAGLDAPTAGDVWLAGRHASSAGRVLVRPERRGVAMVFQGLALFPQLGALDQIAFAARGRGGRPRARSLLERVGLGHRGDAPLDQLSGGERQRVALARVLAQEPELILMDEPFASLDEQLRGDMRGLLRSLLADTAATLILVTHARDDALDLADRVLVLDAGRPVAAGAIEAVMADPRHPAAVRSLGLGQIVQGTSADGRTARTAFGEVTLARLAVPGPVQLLVRPGQAHAEAVGSSKVDGASKATADVVGIERRPSGADGGVRRVVVVRVGDQILRAEIGVERDDRTIAIGGRVTVRIDSPCQQLGDS